MSLEDNFAPKGFIRFNLISCSGCGTKHISPEGIDNSYHCREEECRKNLMGETQITYDVSEGDIAEFLQKNYKGKSIGNRNGT